MTGPTHGLLFERLNESNYVSWAEKMKCFLIRKGLWTAAQKAPDMDDDDEPPVNNNSISKDRGDKSAEYGISSADVTPVEQPTT
uniref:Uncharacterized protein n=1 Tax=Sphaerodactylus townsendi TaxID=933632 RepID=A0ACB8FTU9_9SAUR